MGILFPKGFAATASAITDMAFGSLGWFFVISVTGFLLLCLWLALGRFGRLRLGAPDDRPEFSTASWLSMLFAAGMGVGLLFWGVAEPVLHFSQPPVAAGGTPGAARQAMIITNLHWGLHAWAIYAIGGLVLAYFGFRRGTPNLPGAPMRAMFKGRWVEPLSFSADAIGVLAVSIGVAGSLGMGIFQMHKGLHVLVGVPAESTAVSVGILAVLVVAYMASATTGLDKGIKWLSNINLTIAILLMIFVLLAGPTAFLLDGFVTSVGDYIAALPSISLRLFPYRDLDAWLGSWTLTYFVYWIAWAPFVGVFIARISRGRTIREYVFGVLFAPTVFSALWFSILGGTALHEELNGAGGIAEVINEDVSMAVFTLFARLPATQVLGATAIALVFIFLVTSADSATFVLGMLTSQGSMDPPTSRKVSWGIVIGGLTAAMVFTGNIEALKAVVVVGAVPFAFVMLIQLAAFMKALRDEVPTKAKGGEK